MSQQSDDAVLCPNCRGGNPPAALRCMWCGAPLKAEAANVSSYASPQQQVYAPAPVARKRGCSPLLVVGIVLGVIIIAAVAASSGGGDTANAPSTISGTPRPTVEGPTYEQYKGDHESMTDVQWAAHIKTLAGSHIRNWNGWIIDVVRENDNVYRVEVDQDGPDEAFALADVYIRIPPADATEFNKGQKITYSGTIDHVECAMRFCRVIVRQPTIQR